MVVGGYFVVKHGAAFTFELHIDRFRWKQILKQPYPMLPACWRWLHRAILERRFLCWKQHQCMGFPSHTRSNTLGTVCWFINYHAAQAPVLCRVVHNHWRHLGGRLVGLLLSSIGLILRGRDAGIDVPLFDPWRRLLSAVRDGRHGSLMLYESTSHRSATRSCADRSTPPDFRDRFVALRSMLSSLLKGLYSLTSRCQ